MQEIENFNTGLALNPNANNINLNPSENIIPFSEAGNGK